MKVSIISKRAGTIITEYDGILSITPAVNHEKLCYEVEFDTRISSFYPMAEYNILLHD